MRAEVVIICSFAVAILLFLSNFKLCGVVGDVLRGVQLGIFGMVGYLFPILIFVGTLFPSVQPGKHPCCHEAGSRGRGCDYGLRAAAAGLRYGSGRREVDGIL